MVPATHLWRLFSLVELKENMRQQGDQTFVNLLHALRIGELTADHLEILMSKVNPDEDENFSIEKAVRMFIYLFIYLSL